MKLLLAAGIALSSLVFPALSFGTSLALFSEANTLYQQGDFSAAESLYRRLLASGLEDGAVYYNLGNACFKQNKLGEAIYYWEKAQRRLPRDPEVRENLALANLLVVDRVDIPSSPLPLRWLESSIHLLTIEQESWILVISFACANLLLGIHSLAGSRRAILAALTGSVAAGFLLALVGCSLGWKVYEQKHRQEGIVVEQKADIRSGPTPEHVTVFTVHEGLKVRIRGETGDWYQISLPNGWTGWLEKDALRVL